MKINTLLRCTLISGFALSSLADAKGNAAPAETQQQATAAKIQIAILLDTSGSMSGLIEQTKTQLWKIINTFTDAKQHGQIPYVEVALYEYGNDGLASKENWIRQIQPLTRDLDQISENLFGLSTNGGSEFCGAVIKHASDKLEWDDSKDVYKAIFIAGNEAFTQGSIDAYQSCRESAAKGVYINTIFCGDKNSAVSHSWSAGSKLAGGSALVIDHNRVVQHIESPHDKPILELNIRLNATYLAYGVEGKKSSLRQTAQDGNSYKHSKSGAHLQRAVSKASSNYSNTNWDLIDASKEKGFKVTEIKKAHLPAEMQKMNEQQQLAHIQKKAADRSTIQKEINTLNKQREQWLQTQRKQNAAQGSDTLDSAMISTVRKQATEKGYSFK